MGYDGKILWGFYGACAGTPCLTENLGCKFFLPDDYEKEKLLSDHWALYAELETQIHPKEQTRLVVDWVKAEATVEEEEVEENMKGQ